MRAIDHIGVCVADLDRAIEFWCGRLGLPLLQRITETDPEVAALVGADSIEAEIADLDAGDGQIIELIEYRHPARPAIQADGGGPGVYHIALRVDDLQAVLARLEGSQARQISRQPVVLHDPGGPWDGVTCCYVAVPDGIVVELVERPGAAQ